MESQVSIDAKHLRRFSEREALEFADHILGESELWSPSLIAYRLSSSFQEDWKTEVGSWLLLAKTLGFLDKFKSQRLIRAQIEARNPEGSGVQDSAHRILMSELASLWSTYYLTGVGWGFDAWEPSVVRGDVDVRLVSPSGIVTDIQVKAPDAEQDDRFIDAIGKGAEQLNETPGPGRMVVCATSATWGADVNSWGTYLLGSTCYEDGEITLTESQRGTFGSVDMEQLTAVTELHLVRGISSLLYRSTVILNPWAGSRGLVPDDFANSRLCYLSANYVRCAPVGLGTVV